MLNVLVSLLSVALIVSPIADIQKRLGVRIVPSAGSLLQLSDLTCAGVFLSPQMQTGARTTKYPITYRYESGARHYFMYDGTGHIYEFPEPSLSPCNTAAGSISVASLEGWGGDWGVFNVNAHDNFIPGQNSTFAAGLYYDPITAQLVLSWYPAYITVVFGNSFAAATLNVDHTMTLNGCWGTADYNTLYTGTGMLGIPSSFASHLPAGQTWAAGFGGAIGYAVGSSYGPTLIAMEPPAGNACASDTDYDVTTTTLLEAHESNGTGPNCTNPSGLPLIGCTPGTAPTNPKPAEMAFTGYSASMFDQDWDPYGGHGWWGWEAGGSPGWYDDGVKQGVLVPMSNPSGWINTTILASPSPTGSGSGGTFSVADTDMHDGYDLNPGDLIWVQTCTPGVDAGCLTANLQQFSISRVDSVNTGTGAIAYTVLNGDSGSGTHVPVSGGGIYAGCVYAHGSPTCSRQTWLIQTYNPAQYAEVIAMTRQPYAVRYVEEAAWTDPYTVYGAPSTGAGVQPSIVGNRGVVATMPDPSAQQIMISINNATTGIGVMRSAIYVYDVAHSTPSPSLTAASWPLQQPAKPERLIVGLR